VWVATKFQRPDGTRYWEGNSKHVELFGMQTLKDRGNLIITEGESDSLAVADTMGPSYNVLSISHGAAHAARAVRKVLENLDRFETVYICFDSDEPGQRATNEVIKLFEPTRVRRVVLPTGFKDACELTQQHQAEALKQCIYRASEVKPDGVLDNDDLHERALHYFYNKDEREGISTGFAGLDRLVGGFRPGELITFTGATGIGKSYVVRALAYNAMQAGMKCFYIPLEMTAETTLLQFAEFAAQRKLISDPKGGANVHPDDLKRWLSGFKDTLHLYNHIGSVDPQKLVKTIGHVVRADNVGLVVLDHINAATQDDWQKIDEMCMMLKSTSISQRICILNVCHQSRSEGEKPTNPRLDKMRGSAGIGHLSDAVFGIGRERDSTTTEISTLKAHRLIGEFGSVQLDLDTTTRVFTEVGSNVTATRKANDTGRSEVQEPVRSFNSTGEPVADVRTEAAGVPSQAQVHTGLDDSQGGIHRVEGSVHSSRPDESIGSPSRASRRRARVPVPELELTA